MLQGAVGYQPVITTLPEGTNLVATAVISADRRYVRISAVPLFSSIGNITTFNFATGAQSVQSGSGGQLGQGACKPRVARSRSAVGWAMPTDLKLRPHSSPDSAAVGSAHPTTKCRGLGFDKSDVRLMVMLFSRRQKTTSPFRTARCRNRIS